MCVHVRKCTCVVQCHRGQKKVLDILELELWTAVKKIKTKIITIAFN